jgi:hypothetical protein
MKKLTRYVLLILTLTLLSNSLSAAVINEKNEEGLATLAISLNSGGLITLFLMGPASDAALTVGLYAIMAGGVSGATVLANKASTTTDENKKVSKILKAEIANYHSTGEMGIYLQSIINTLHDNKINISETETIDAISNGLE